MGNQFVVISVFSALMAAGCSDDPLRGEAERVMQRVRPTDSTGGGLTSFNRSSTGVEASWIFTITNSWSDYAKSAAQQLAPDYSCVTVGSVMRCSRSLQGDLYTVTLTSDRSEPPSNINAVFAARAD